MIGVSGFVSKVRSIAARDLTYRTGGSGKDGTCDCIGLIIGAMTELGHKKYDMHSTNYFARYQVLELKDVTQKDLFVGQILFRTRESPEKLNARYQRGGRYYTGDLLDYYHVAVVTSRNPLEIIECTEYGDVSGIVVNTRFKNWQCGGKLKDVLYDGYEEEEKQVIEAIVPPTVLYQAVVTTEKDPLSVREWPQTGPIMGKVPKGRVVEVISDVGDGWPRIRYNELVGVASEKYLQRIDAGETSEAELPENVIQETPLVTIVDSAGNKFQPVGDYKTYIGGID